VRRFKVCWEESINCITPVRSQPRQKAVIATLAGLFIITIVQLIVQWYYTSTCFVGTPDNRQDTFLLSLENSLSPVVTTVFLIAQGIGQILADSLLVNIFYVQSHSPVNWLVEFRFGAAGGFYLNKDTSNSDWYVSILWNWASGIYIIKFNCSLCTTVFILISTLFQGLFNFVPGDHTSQWAQRYNIIQGISFCVTAATSVLATFIIAAKIHRSNINNHARRRYRHIIEITIQSSTLYTLSTLGIAVTGLINNGYLNPQGSTVLDAQLYLNALTVITTVSYSQISILNH